jgi:hypothetical protein
VSKNPAVLLTRDYIAKGGLPALQSLLKVPGPRCVWLLVQVTVNLDQTGCLKRLLRWKNKLEKDQPRLRLFFLTASEHDCVRLHSAGIPAEWIHHDTFTDPGAFHPLKKVKKHFDVICDARLPVLEHRELTAKIAGLGLVMFSSPDAWGKGKSQAVQWHMEEAFWASDLFLTDHEALGAREFNAIINQGRVGLCLTEEKGGASLAIQYLLAGIPVVTTQDCRMDKDFLDPEFVLTVAASPGALAAGVDEMKRRNLCPELIHRKTSGRLDAHQRRFHGVLGRIKAGKEKDFFLSPQFWPGRWKKILATGRRGGSGKILKKMP